MNARLPAILGAALGLLAAGCGQADGPVLCLFLANPPGAMVDPKTQSCDAVNAAQQHKPLVLRAGKDVFVIRHELPAGIEPPESLHLTIQPPCGPGEQLDTDYGLIDDRRVALVTRVAPEGADCSLVVTATIANSTLVATTVADSSTCKIESCPADAGTADAGTADAGTADAASQ